MHSFLFSYVFLFFLIAFPSFAISVEKSEMQKQADLVIFSYDRPMQLYALLESINEYVEGIHSIAIVYRTSNERYDRAYHEVMKDFPKAHFLKQSRIEQFKPLTLQAIKNNSSEYILFAVDDNIVKDYVPISECIEWLEKMTAYGFYLRLGCHLNFCYPLHCPQNVPPCIAVNEDIKAWSFETGQWDWGYPNTLDMTLYQKNAILNEFETLNYDNPNQLEGKWMATWVQNKFSNQIGLFYENSKIINIPLNRVQSENYNRTMNSFTPKELLEKFEEGFKIDIKPLHQVKNRSAHFEYEPTFIKRCCTALPVK